VSCNRQCNKKRVEAVGRKKKAAEKKIFKPTRDVRSQSLGPQGDPGGGYPDCGRIRVEKKT